MPGMDGFELLSRLRESGLRDTPVVAVTGFARTGDRKKAFDAGFDEHLGKPLRYDAFLEVVTRLVKERAAKQR